LTISSTNTVIEKTRILYGAQNTTNAILQLLYKSKGEIDICSNHIVLSTAIGDEAFKKGLGDARNRGARLRYVTEITKQNIAYCKELMEIVELRHLDGLKANFILNKTEYVSIHLLWPRDPIDNNKVGVLFNGKQFKNKKCIKLSFAMYNWRKRNSCCYILSRKIESHSNL
jgi:hypothetical protein